MPPPSSPPPSALWLLSLPQQRRPAELIGWLFLTEQCSGTPFRGPVNVTAPSIASFPVPGVGKGPGIDQPVIRQAL